MKISKWWLRKSGTSIKNHWRFNIIVHTHKFINKSTCNRWKWTYWIIYWYFENTNFHTIEVFGIGASCYGCWYDEPKLFGLLNYLAIDCRWCFHCGEVSIRWQIIDESFEMHINYGWPEFEILSSELVEYTILSHEFWPSGKFRIIIWFNHT